MHKPTKLPSLDLVELKFDYDPIEGLLIRKKTGTVVASVDRTTGMNKVRVGRKTTTVARIVWYLFYREDPVGYYIEHIDGDPHNNKIKNLRKVRFKRKK